MTTYDAGMAVPDWPTTYGYNLFLYPWQTWLLGPWDLFIEHGHRLLGAVVGMLTIVLAAALWLRDARRWMGWLGLAAVAGVVFQGVLGGLRVRLDERLLAQIHGCVGPVFFALASALAVCASRRWLCSAEPGAVDRGGPFRLPQAAATTAVLGYVQLLLGSQLRHMPVTADATMFRLAVFFHLIVAVVLTAHVFITWRRAEREAAGNSWLVRPARGLVALIVAQLALGAAAWVVNYGWPAWLSSYGWAAGFVVTREGFAQAIVTTGHVAFGSLILATAVVLALRSWKVAAEQPGLGRGAA
ncbi:MAG: COX15/CtaA family protein, partial [Candidatus Saccharimonadales bacterium]